MNKHIPPASANATGLLVYTGACRLHSIDIRQHTFDAPALCVQIHNVVAPTIGTDAPLVVIPIPAGRTGFQAVKTKVQFSSNNGGLIMSTGIFVAVTTTHDGLTAPDSGDEPDIYVDFEPV